jgi:hypothetical protein
MQNALREGIQYQRKIRSEERRERRNHTSEYTPQAGSIFEVVLLELPVEGTLSDIQDLSGATGLPRTSQRGR